MTKITREQSANAFVKYQLDWPDFGEAIINSTWDADLELTLSSNAIDGSTTSVWVQNGIANKWYAILNTVTGASGKRDSKVIRLYITGDDALLSPGSDLFPSKLTAIETLRRDSLLMASKNHFPNIELDDSVIWDKLRAAESEIAHILGVRFRPTTFFPTPPSDADIAALNGAPWAEDPAYDFEPTMFDGERWALLQLRNKPVSSVKSLKFIYPVVSNDPSPIPAEWIRLDRKYGHLQIVPTRGVFAGMTAVAMNIFGAGRHIPQMLHITYVAGLENPARDYPELIDVVKKLAVLKVIESGFSGASGSISADGLSQSISIDMDKYHDVIDRVIHGQKGSNGGLMTAIHGVKLGVC